MEASDDFIVFSIWGGEEQFNITPATEMGENEFWALSVDEGVESELVENVNSEYYMMQNS